MSNIVIFGKNVLVEVCFIFEYMTVKEVTEKCGLFVRRIQLLRVKKHIEVVMNHAYVWVISKDADEPKDERIIAGKYIKPKNNNQ